MPSSRGAMALRFCHRTEIETAAGGAIPAVYRVNLREPAAYFYARAMMLKDKDVLYVSNARDVEVGKVIALLNLATRTVGNVLQYRAWAD